MTTFKTILVADGEIANHTAWDRHQFEHLICTDGAADVLRSANMMPDTIIGDLDSLLLTYPSMSLLALQFPSANIIKQEDQDTTDFEKGLIYAQQHLEAPVLCLGLFGKAIDHTLHNLCLFAKYAAKYSAAKMISNTPQIPPLVWFNAFESEHQWGLLLPNNCCIYTEIDSIISFFPMNEATLTTQGLKWELKQQKLAQNGFQSVRNRSCSTKIEVTCHGACFAILSQYDCPKIELAP